MDGDTRSRLESVGIDPDNVEDAHRAWELLFSRIGRRATVTDRYAIEAAARGVDPDRLSSDDRERLAREVLEYQFPGIEMLGETSRMPIDVVPYDPQWPLVFADWRRRIRAGLPRTATIRHVGSTAVPNLVAKPTVDIQIAVDDLEDEGRYRAAIEALGTPLRSRDPMHRYFRPPAGEPRVVHIHVCASGSAWEHDHLLFRDYLRTYSDARDEYGSLKMRLAVEYRDDRLAYTDAKTEFILGTLDRARTWAQTTGWSLPDK